MEFLIREAGIRSGRKTMFVCFFFKYLNECTFFVLLKCFDLTVYYLVSWHISFNSLSFTILFSSGGFRGGFSRGGGGFRGGFQGGY